VSGELLYILILRFFFFFFSVLNLKIIFMCVWSQVKSLMPDDNLTRYLMGKRHFSSEGKRIPEVTEFQVQFVFFSCIFLAVKLL